MDKSKQKIRKLRREQLDEFYAGPISLASPVIPSGAWIRDIREALGMSGAQMARILGVTPPALKNLESSEAKQTIELRTLRRVAEAMRCRLVYALVPESPPGSLDGILKEQAAIVAAKLLEQVSHTMALEDQAVSPQEHRRQLQELAEELVRNLDKRLWDSK